MISALLDLVTFLSFLGIAVVNLVQILERVKRDRGYAASRKWTSGSTSSTSLGE